MVKWKGCLSTALYEARLCQDTVTSQGVTATQGREMAPSDGRHRPNPAKAGLILILHILRVCTAAPPLSSLQAFVRAAGGSGTNLEISPGNICFQEETVEIRDEDWDQTEMVPSSATFILKAYLMLFRGLQEVYF